jgi:hypothetical protein
MRADRPPTSSWLYALVASMLTMLAVVAAVYRERRRQRTQLSIWRRLQIREDGEQAAAPAIAALTR